MLLDANTIHSSEMIDTSKRKKRYNLCILMKFNMYCSVLE